MAQICCHFKKANGSWFLWKKSSDPDHQFEWADFTLFRGKIWIWICCHVKETTDLDLYCQRINGSRSQLQFECHVYTLIREPWHRYGSESVTEICRIRIPGLNPSLCYLDGENVDIDPLPCQRPNRSGSVLSKIYQSQIPGLNDPYLLYLGKHGEQ